MDCGLYVHVPFCKKKCNYCDFVSLPESEEFIAKYFRALEKEIEMRRDKDVVIKTVFFGGGTPSFVDAKLVAGILEKIKNNFVCDIKECTVECNPESVTAEKMRIYKEAGVNRISIGVQTLNDNLLRYIGRIHDKNTAINAVTLAKTYFENVSVDLMLGLPYQTVNDVYETLSDVVPLGVTHISAYGLKVEEGTLLCDMCREGMCEINEDLTADMYDYTVRTLAENGFERYEISNFAKRGYESLHNLGYWRRTPYIGIGAAAYGFKGKTRYNNILDVYKYVECVENGVLPVAGEERLSVKDEKEETVMLSLRTRYGLDVAKFNRDFSCDYLADKASALQTHKDNIFIFNDTLFLKEDKYYISNYILSDLI